MEPPRTERILLLLLGGAAILAVLGCVVSVAVLQGSAAALRPGACKPAAKRDQLGRLLFEIPRLSAADEPWDFPPHLAEIEASGASASATPAGRPSADVAPADAAPTTREPQAEKP